MADSAKDLEIKLRATGGADAASQVDDVVEAVEDLTDAATEAGEASEKAATTAEEWVPAWEGAGEAVEEVAKAWADWIDSLSRTTPKVDGSADSIDAVAAAAESAAEAIGDMESATTEAGDAFADIQKPIDATAEWLERIAHRAPRTQEGVIDLTREFNLLLKALTKIPGPGGAAIGTIAKFVGLGARFGPWGAAVAAAGAVGAGGMKLLLDRLREIDEASKRLAPDLPRHFAGAAVQASSLANQTRRAADAAKEADTAYAGYTARLRALATAQAAVIDAALGAELAQIDLDELEGNLTQAEAAHARHSARRAADERKTADEIAAIEEALHNRRMLNEQERAEWLAAQRPAREAQTALDQARREGAAAVPGLGAEQERHRAAILARGRATTTDPAALDALDAELVASREALNEAYQKLIDELIAERDAAAATVAERSRRLRAGRADEAGLQSELDDQQTGTAAQAREARRREEDIRLNIDDRRREQAEEKRRADEAARLALEQAEAERRRIDAETADLAREINERIDGATNASPQAEATLAEMRAARDALQGTTKQVSAAQIEEEAAALDAYRAANDVGRQTAELLAAYADQMRQFASSQRQLENNLRQLHDQFRNSR